MRSPTHYRAKLDYWRQWLEDNASGKSNHLATARKLVAVFEAMIPEAETAFGRLHDVVPSTELATCAGPGCERSFPARTNKRTCSVACRQALRRRDAKAQVKRPAQEVGQSDRRPPKSVTRRPRSEGMDLAPTSPIEVVSA